MFSAVHFVPEIQIVWFCPESTRHASANAAPLDLIAGKIHVDGKGRRPPAAPLRVIGGDPLTLQFPKNAPHSRKGRVENSALTILKSIMSRGGIEPPTY